MRMLKILHKNKILAFAILTYILLFLYNTNLGLKALGEAAYYFREMIEILPPIFILISLIQTWVPTKLIIKHFGNSSGLKGTLLAFCVGSFSAGPLYAAFPVCKMLLNKGASIENVLIILGSWATIKIPMLINELKFMGFRYMFLRWILSVIAILVMAFVMKLVLRKPYECYQIAEKTQKSTTDIQLTINRSLCIGCGKCVGQFPHIYKLKQGKAVLIQQPKELTTEKYTHIKNTCPTQAIT